MVFSIKNFSDFDADIINLYEFDKFKMNFNGQVKEYYNVTIINSFKESVLKAINQFLRR